MSTLQRATYLHGRSDVTSVPIRLFPFIAPNTCSANLGPACTTLANASSNFGVLSTEHVQASTNTWACFDYMLGGLHGHGGQFRGSFDKITAVLRQMRSMAYQSRNNNVLDVFSHIRAVSTKAGACSARFRPFRPSLKRVRPSPMSGDLD